MTQIAILESFGSGRGAGEMSVAIQSQTQTGGVHFGFFTVDDLDRYRDASHHARPRRSSHEQSSGAIPSLFHRAAASDGRRDLSTSAERGDGSLI